MTLIRSDVPMPSFPIPARVRRQRIRRLGKPKAGKKQNIQKTKVLSVPDRDMLFSLSQDYVLPVLHEEQRKAGRGSKEAIGYTQIIRSILRPAYVTRNHPPNPNLTRSNGVPLVADAIATGRKFLARVYLQHAHLRLSTKQQRQVLNAALAQPFHLKHQPTFDEILPAVQTPQARQGMNTLEMAVTLGRATELSRLLKEQPDLPPKTVRHLTNKALQNERHIRAVQRRLRKEMESKPDTERQALLNSKFKTAVDKIAYTFTDSLSPERQARVLAGRQTHIPELIALSRLGAHAEVQGPISVVSDLANKPNERKGSIATSADLLNFFNGLGLKSDLPLDSEFRTMLMTQNRKTLMTFMRLQDSKLMDKYAQKHFENVEHTAQRLPMEEDRNNQRDMLAKEKRTYQSVQDKLKAELKIFS